MDETSNLFNLMITLNKIAFVNSILIFLIGGTLNIILLYICYKIKNNEFKACRKMITLFTFTDLMYIITQSFTIHVGGAGNKTGILCSIGLINNFGEQIAIFGILAGVFFYLCTITNNFVISAYRYLIIVRGVKFTNFKFFILMSTNFIWNFLVVLIWYIDIKLTDKNEFEKTKNGIPYEYFIGLNNSTVPCIFFNPFKLRGIVIFVQTNLTFVLIVFGSSELIYLIHNKLKNNTSVSSPKTKKLQSQLTLIMLIELVNPLVLTIIPVLPISYSVIMGYDLHGFMHIMLILMAWSVIINPIATILCIGPILKYLTSFFHKKKFFVNVVPIK
uniref:G_PROTEIN_RECEP_F1_2 domain-containing protein n=1 Tax=Rhabditophanes sp. KR3021 TaxID=114890 RepID=A0AC35U8X7_9BILA